MEEYFEIIKKVTDIFSKKYGTEYSVSVEQGWIKVNIDTKDKNFKIEFLFRILDSRLIIIEKLKLLGYINCSISDGKFILLDVYEYLAALEQIFEWYFNKIITSDDINVQIYQKAIQYSWLTQRA